MKKILLIAIAMVAMTACQKTDNSSPTPAPGVTSPDAPTTDVPAADETYQPPQAPPCLVRRHFRNPEHLCQDLRLDLRRDQCSTAERYDYFMTHCRDYDWQTGRRHDGRDDHGHGGQPVDPRPRH